MKTVRNILASQYAETCAKDSPLKRVLLLWQSREWEQWKRDLCEWGGVSLIAQESTCNAGDMGSIPGLGRCPGGRHGNQLQYSCLESPMDRRASWSTACGSIHPIHPEKEESNRNPIVTSLGNLENVPSVHTFTVFCAWQEKKLIFWIWLQWLKK